MEPNREGHLLTLKVMRLSQPQLVRSNPISYEPTDTLHDVLPALDPSASDLSLTELYKLPNSIGDTYMGQAFACFVSVHNDSNDIVTNVICKVELQSGSKRTTLSSDNTTLKLSPDQSVDQIVRHELSDIDTHVLVCSVMYTTDEGERKSIRKFFKFKVLKPVDIRPHCYTVKDCVFLEAVIENLTDSPITIQSVRLDPAESFDVMDCNVTPPRLCAAEDIPDPKHKSTSVFGNVSQLNSKSKRHYLYKLLPKPELDRMTARTTVAIGKIDVVWRSQLGGRGHIQTSQVLRKTPQYDDVHLEPIDIPTRVTMGQIFQVKAAVVNFGGRPQTLTIRHLTGKNPAFVLQDLQSVVLEQIPQHGELEVTLQFLALRPGCHRINNLTVQDSKATYTATFPEILVLRDEDVSK
eukprot:m.155664 g.155664  ORF g.155664 m.155664 type:complete len:408 (-) comp16423_c0_seq1:2383-3606(-)